MIVVAKIQFSDGEQVQTLGVSDAPYFGDASGLWNRRWYPVIDTSTDARWSEFARHPYQGQADIFSVGELSLINVSGLFDDWAEYAVSGLLTEVQRGPSTATWNTESDRYDVFHDGKMEPLWRANGKRRRFEGRSRLILSFESLLAPLSGALNKEVFDENTPNENLIGRTAPMLLGRVFQMSPDLSRPQHLNYFAGWNLHEVEQVQEGGNPTDGWVPHDQGFALTRSALLAITCHANGPPPDDDSEVDKLDGIGDMDFDTSGDLQGFDVFEDDPDAVIDEDSSGDAVVTITGDASTGSDDDNRASDIWQLQSGGQWGWTLRPVSVGAPAGQQEIADALEADQTTEEYLSSDIGGDSTSTRLLRLRNWSPTLGPTDLVTGVEVRVRAKKESGSTAGIFFQTVSLQLPNGSISDNKADDVEVTSTKTNHIFGNSTDKWGFDELSVDDLQSTTLGLLLQFKSASTGVFATQVQVHEVELVVHTGNLATSVRLYADVGLVSGRDYRLEITTLDTTGSIEARWAGVESSGDSLASAPSPFSTFSATLSKATVTVAEFNAAGSVFGIEFFKGATSGTNTIQKIELWQKPTVDKYVELVRYIIEQAGLDPDIHLDTAMVQAHSTATGDPPLGWLVKGSETADELLFLLAGSIGGMLWHDRGGRVKSLLLQPPSTFGAEIGEERIIGDIEVFDDDPPNITDRVVGAKNWRPIAEDRAAGITTTFTEQDRSDVSADYRVTRFAQFPDLEGY